VVSVVDSVLGGFQDLFGQKPQETLSELKGEFVLSRRLDKRPPELSIFQPLQFCDPKAVAGYLQSITRNDVLYWTIYLFLCTVAFFVSLRIFWGGGCFFFCFKFFFPQKLGIK